MERRGSILSCAAGHIMKLDEVAAIKVFKEMLHFKVQSRAEHIRLT